MDDIMAYNLPKFKLIHINSVRLFLRINLLSEITNHTGTQLLPMSMHKQKPQSDDTYQSTNQSTLSWPRQSKVPRNSSVDNLERNNPVDIRNKLRNHPKHTPGTVAAPILNKF